MQHTPMSSLESAPRYAAPALTKGLHLLEVLAASPSAMSQAYLARALNKSSAEIFRMLTLLGQEGYVRRDPHGAYRPALKLFALGRTVDPLRALLAAAEVPMREFAQATGQECHLSVLDGGALVVLAQESRTAPVSIRVRVGSRHDPRATASGRLLLALLPPPRSRPRDQIGPRAIRRAPPRRGYPSAQTRKDRCGRLFRGTQRITIRSCGYSCSPAETRTSYPRSVGQL